MTSPFTDISIDDYRDHFEGKQDYFLVDVREEDEFDSGHLPGAVNVPLSQFMALYADDIPTDKPVVLVCRTGVRSAQAAAFLAQMGDWDDLYNLIDGTLLWQMRGLPLE